MDLKKVEIQSLSVAAEKNIISQARADDVVVEPVTQIEKDRIVYTHTRKIPINPKMMRQNRILVGEANHPAASSYRMLRTQVLQKIRDKNWNCIGIVSPTPGDGKTLTAINLAISMAQEVRHTVMLVDCDLRKPSIHRFFAFEPDRGISDFIRGNVPLEEILVNPGVPGLVILPGRESVDNSSEMLTSPRVIKMVDEIKHRYSSRIVLFDIPPVLCEDDALAFLPYVDSALMVLTEGKTRQKDVIHALEMLHGVPVLGTILNKSTDFYHSS